MNVSQMIAELRSEREAIDQAIAVLQRLASTHERRRGRPPAWLADTVRGEAGPKREMSPETKKKMAIAQRKRWAAYRKAKEVEE
jgi:hypothetical protein